MSEPTPGSEAVDTPSADGDKAKRVGLPRPSSRRWGMNPEDRIRVMEACLVLPGPGWIIHFGLMMTMSVIVAIMGLSANSPALVIGAMLIAPLMTPVLGIAASIAMALGDSVLRAVITVVLATCGAIAAGFIIAGWLPGELLTGEVLARTAPDARDLVVALAAGIAGSYATARPDVSSSLPGVAIAVALVPPLAVVGITLRAGEGELALGALLLYATNLAAIVTVSTIVFVLAGFVPGRRLANMAPRVLAGGLVALVLVAILGVLLGSRSLESGRRSTQITEINEATEIWLRAAPFNSASVDVSDENRVEVTVTGPSDLPDTADLRAEVVQILEDQDAELQVTWIQGQTLDSLTFQEEERTRTVAEQEAADAAAAERASMINEVVDEWLASENDRSLFEVTSLEIGDDAIALGVASAISLPPVEELESRLQQRLDEGITAVVSLDDLSAAQSQQAISEAESAARVIVQQFADERGLTVEEVSFDGSTVVADLEGAEPPVGDELEQALIDELGDVEVLVFFVQKIPVIPAPTPTPTPEPTPTPAPTATPDPDAPASDEDGAEDADSGTAEDPDETEDDADGG